MKKAVIITIGNEILSGRTLNTNFTYIARKLTYLGYDVLRGIIVKDDIEEIGNAFKSAIESSDLVVSSGGLGPTYDDMTLLSFSKAFNLKLTLNNDALEMIKEKFDNMTPEREKMAMIPENCVPIRNDAGTAPGVLVNINNKNIIILPGVPREVESIFENVQERIKVPGYVYYDKSLRLDGVLESIAAPLIKEYAKNNPDLYIKSHPYGIEFSKPGIELEVSGRGDSSIYEKVDRVLRELSEKLMVKR
ncbi:nicotinamide mononucleotide deamidase-related protein [Picrophilus oshimae]|uniref:Predicted nucleotide-utilizing enzyme n=1 Tax=Picrophilus torridus (strain ATCC 700027 / DSM 9790 / JCM 10055 / NBRC 100828 / KAW 2/3) TaxID=1122961 RepID=Q6L2J5_PICTO|nr:nicotinamide mononucleotide deamidase-related protein [Picrophilus oshimae]AAT42807.1 predicted nucleotide-utilizing enzyme [Picrophilus oshimae DSM 9789]